MDNKKSGRLGLLLALIIPVMSVAQNPVLNKYIAGEGLTLTGNNGYKMNLRGYSQFYAENKTYSSDTLDRNFMRFRVRRLRLRLSGDVPQYKMDYRFQMELSGQSEVGDEDPGSFLMDAWVAYNPTKRIKIKFGQSVSPTDNRELSMGSQTLQLVERSRVTSAFSTIREFGIVASGNFRTGRGTYLRPYLTVTNGDGINAFTADRGGLKVGGRLDFLPFGLFTNYGQYRQADVVRELTPKLVIGTNYSMNNGMSSRRGRGSGDITYLNNDLEETLPDFTKFGVDFLFKFRGFSVLGEFVKTWAAVPSALTTRVRIDGSTSTNLEFDGQQDPENYVKNRMMLGEGYNIQAGYLFKNRLSIDARYTHLEADRASFLNNNLFYNRPNYYTIGVSKYMSRNYGFKVQASLMYNDLGDGATDISSDRTTVTGNELTARVITSFAF
jgi:hypothetical protein